MKTLLLSVFTLLTLISFDSHLKAQAANQATFENYLRTVYDAYESGDSDAMWAFYSDDATEITPDGRLTSGKAALKADWDEFMKMVDSKPTFTYKLSSWRLLADDIALVTWDSDADIKVGGQQFGGPTICVAVLRKVNGNWLIEFDGMTPTMPTPSDN